MKSAEEIIAAPGCAGGTDHPLNISPDSMWSTYFKDNEVLLQIDKDVRRLCPDISFFQSATEFPCEEVCVTLYLYKLCVSHSYTE